ncbi:MAG: hypothetical protein A3K41_09915 [Chloroflexi bacterium RIFOXYD12_FULL_57_15]|nr:MAG: hypothetical protein A3K41_09915 [Chloroflexi bacterium RIFOXYD12_FULL_57_15]
MNWELDFKKCLEKRWLVSMAEARFLVTKELTAAHDDLAEAQASFQRGGYKWSAIRPTTPCSTPQERCFTAAVFAKRVIIVSPLRCVISLSARDYWRRV